MTVEVCHWATTTRRRYEVVRREVGHSVGVRAFAGKLNIYSTCDFVGYPRAVISFQPIPPTIPSI